MICDRCENRQSQTHQLWHRDAEYPQEKPAYIGLCDECYTKFRRFLEGKNPDKAVPIEDFRSKKGEAGLDRVG